jgi:hypothetical protein
MPIFHRIIFKGIFHKKESLFTGFGHLQTSETVGRKMAVELDSRNPFLPKTGWENEDLTLILILGQIINFFILNGAYQNFYGNLN